LVDIQEVRLAACHLALSKIFLLVANASDASDRWLMKAKQHKAEYDKAIDVAFLTYDRIGSNVTTPTIVGCAIMRRG
jgi:hypothetical protein